MHVQELEKGLLAIFSKSTFLVLFNSLFHTAENDTTIDHRSNYLICATGHRPGIRWITSL